MGAPKILDERSSISLERCIGCGLCVSTCTTEALKLVPKEEAPVPPVNQQELGAAMIASRQQSS